MQANVHHEVAKARPLLLLGGSNSLLTAARQARGLQKAEVDLQAGVH